MIIKHKLVNVHLTSGNCAVIFTQRKVVRYNP